jgi:hypothetical protein
MDVYIFSIGHAKINDPALAAGFDICGGAIRQFVRCTPRGLPTVPEWW